MKSSSFPDLANGRARSMTDEKMDQVRELLFGEFEKQTEQRVADLEARVRELEVGLHRRLDAIEARLEALAGEMDVSQRSAHEEMAAGIQELANKVRRIGAG